MSEESPFYRILLKAVPALSEPGVSPHPNPIRDLCFPFVIWERKSDSTSSLFKGAKPISIAIDKKALDILEALNITELPIIGMVTLGAKFEFYVAYIVPSAHEKYV